MAKESVKDWSAADRRYGWKLGCDGWVTVRDAAPMLGYVPAYIYELISMDDRSEPGSKAYPLRAAKDPVNNRRLKLCLRSIQEFNSRRQPIEV